jgi:hypothetical protein
LFSLSIRRQLRRKDRSSRFHVALVLSSGVCVCMCGCVRLCLCVLRLWLWWYVFCFVFLNVCHPSRCISRAALCPQFLINLYPLLPEIVGYRCLVLLHRWSIYAVHLPSIGACVYLLPALYLCEPWVTICVARFYRSIGVLVGVGVCVAVGFSSTSCPPSRFCYPLSSLR